MESKSKGKFTGNEGVFIPNALAKERTSRFHEKKIKQGHKPKTYVEAQFFGRNKIEELLKEFDKECVGLRFYFMVTEDKEFADQLVAVAVDENGVDLTETAIGLKDMPSPGKALVGGPTCPSVCNP